ncbi:MULTISPECIES: hypothetical protein [Kamptonema]|uniref:hypothetical protein n=1 Tax=Kamptonema TaxID=1501433 RepID=UPI0001DAD6F0|nr:MULTISPECIES: hypothetical protein [Kamptonema]CBN53625.1 hypothetical protein OSCI_30021 [Kamptonema sp. PCC 6506]
MVTHNISANISETAFQLDIYPTKKAERFPSHQHFLTDTVRQCVKIYQLEPRDWQQISQAINPSCMRDVSLENKHYSKALVSGFLFALAMVHQCIQIMNTKPIVWQQFYRG